MVNFFISYNKANRRWAEWVAWTLEEAGFSVLIQDWDFRPGSNFILEMNRAAQETERTIAILSPEYIDSLYTKTEWAAALAQDPDGTKQKLIPVRVKQCELKGLLAQMVYIDLVNLDETAAKTALLKRIRKTRAKPTLPPAYPEKITPSLVAKPVFPIEEHQVKVLSSAAQLWNWFVGINLKKLAFIGTLIGVSALAGWTVYSHFFQALPNSKTFERQINEGEKLLNIGHYAEAKQKFQEAINTFPKNQQAKWGLRKAAVWETSGTVFKQEIDYLYQENPKDAHVNLFQGMYYAASHKIEKAFPLCRKAIELNPNLAEAYFCLGLLYTQLGAIDDAEKNYLKAVEISQATPKYSNNLAAIYAKQQKYKQAIETFGKNSEYPLSALEISKLFWLLGRPDQALGFQLQALQWLENPTIVAKSENKEPWWFFQNDQSGIELIDLNEKKSYVLICLSVTQYLLDQPTLAVSYLRNTKQLEVPMQSNIIAILKYDLDDLAQKNVRLKKKIIAYQRLYLK